MIVLRRRGSLLLVRQPDHAALAARILSCWTADGLPGRPTRAALLEAVEHHDDGWLPLDDAPRVDPQSGEPYDYVSYPLPERQALWFRAVDALEARSSYVAALVAQHAVTAYDRYRGEPAWEPFFDGLARRRDELLQVGGAEALAADYPLLRLADLLALAFCHHETDSAERAGYAYRMDAERLLVTPDPFAGAEVPLEVAARRLEDRPYGSDEDLRAAYAAAPVELLRGTASGEA